MECPSLHSALNGAANAAATDGAARKQAGEKKSLRTIRVRELFFAKLLADDSNEVAGPQVRFVERIIPRFNAELCAGSLVIAIGNAHATSTAIGRVSSASRRRAWFLFRQTQTVHHDTRSSGPWPDIQSLGRVDIEGPALPSPVHAAVLASSRRLIDDRVNRMARRSRECLSARRSASQAKPFSTQGWSDIQRISPIRRTVVKFLCSHTLW